MCAGLPVFGQREDRKLRERSAADLGHQLGVRERYLKEKKSVT